MAEIKSPCLKIPLKMFRHKNATAEPSQWVTSANAKGRATPPVSGIDEKNCTGWAMMDHTV